MQLYFKPVLILFFIVSSCSKEKVETPKNLILKNKTLSKIKSVIQGKWLLHYSHGGITGNIHQKHINSFIDFTASDSIYWDENNTLIVADKIEWIKRKDIAGDSTYIMFFCERRGSACYPYSWGAEQMKNDTLILYDNSTDPMAYYLTKN